MLGTRAAVTAALLAVGLAAQATGELRTVDGRTLSGSLIVDGAGAAVLTQESGPVALDLADVVSFAPAGAERTEVTAPHRVWLRSGAELPAVRLTGRAAAGGRPTALVAELPSGVAVAVPFGHVRAVRHGGSERPEPARFQADLADPPANEDVLFVQKDGQSHRSLVAIAGFADDRVEFALRGTAYTFPLIGVTGIVCGRNTGFAPDRQGKPRTSLLLTTGERLEGRLLAFAETIRLRLDEGAEVDVPATALLRLEVRSDRLLPLTELEPRVEQTPAFDRVWPWLVDRTPAGPGFELAGVKFEGGIGMVPRTRLTYDLGRRFDRFEAWIGIDDRGGPAAHAVFRVYVDGREVFESEPKVHGAAPTRVEVELGRCGELSIECDFGRNYDLGDYCAWADARVVQR